ncbi:TlpA family protein disulfide reductase [Mesorhizobium sp. 1B3]|uniref:TlpA family protein disulfide reductase n=1 Tax=Mesorhizobium sp. 1B3 TaxID=3243599 RepID=UPI003D994041
MPSHLLRSVFFAGLALGMPTAFSQPASETTATKPVETAAPRAVVVDFENETALNALAAKGKTVVFFFASWCPNCRATVSELNARWADVNPDITLVVADYDKEAGLKAKFGITYQDTFVLLDEKGNATKLWNGGGVAGLNANTSF